ncbi:RNA polymerase subunit sigma [Bacillus pseudomycoides]|uniref:RNA polymerase subunit sigma n=1 Tax=Bacillus TaxID=1386 RepID=UPI000BFD52EC|nr:MULTISPECIES: RNA polymerase subunit sigma [Bacillus]MCX2825291.1 RNA polymerase subunit sigma [Bacillus sp. DHT2]MDR4919141.1 RNA polymerase subunit sigma [Bacillus pseudomycoides]PHB31775.1 RNA polymerase subunit sigma [Bacillus pseudomycoides]
MTVDYKNPNLNDYKNLIRYDAQLNGEITIAKTFNDVKKLEELQQEKKLVEIRIKIIEASFTLKHKWVKEKATA